MKDLSKEDLKQLMQVSGSPCVSIYMPTFRTGSETQQGRIVLKNLIRQAYDQLVAQGMRTSDARKFLDPVQLLIVDNYFWQFQLDGLVIFIADGFFECFSLPIEFAEILVVNNRFHLKPLLPWVSSDGKYYVLALSQNSIRVLRCNRATVEELGSEHLPENLADALRFDDPQRELQYHSNTLESSNDHAAAMYHGNGDNSEDQKDRILRYFHLVDRGMGDLLRQEKAPLILSGVDYLFPIYKVANTYPYLIEEGIPGNPEEISSDDLHKKSWEIIHPYFQQNLEEALTYFGPFRGTDRCSFDLQETTAAAYNGQVELLFVTDRGQQWGKFHPESNLIELHSTAQSGDEDLLDFASIQTILNGGSVFVLESQYIPEEATLAALFRY